MHLEGWKLSVYNILKKKNKSSLVFDFSSFHSLFERIRYLTNQKISKISMIMRC